MLVFCTITGFLGAGEFVGGILVQGNSAEQAFGGSEFGNVV